MSEEYLVHHGVLGMKWGVRHENTKTTRKQKKIERKEAISVGKKKTKVVGRALISGAKAITGIPAITTIAGSGINAIALSASFPAYAPAAIASAGASALLGAAPYIFTKTVSNMYYEEKGKNKV